MKYVFIVSVYFFRKIITRSCIIIIKETLTRLNRETVVTGFHILIFCFFLFVSDKQHIVQHNIQVTYIFTFPSYILLNYCLLFCGITMKYDTCSHIQLIHKHIDMGFEGVVAFQYFCFCFTDYHR